jgi:hypothetical protein
MNRLKNYHGKMEFKFRNSKESMLNLTPPDLPIEVKSFKCDLLSNSSIIVLIRRLTKKKELERMKTENAQSEAILRSMFASLAVYFNLIQHAMQIHSSQPY